MIGHLPSTASVQVVFDRAYEWTVSSAQGRQTVLDNTGIQATMY